MDIEAKSKAREVSSFSTTSPIAQQIQTILLIHPSIQLGWIKAHMGHKGNKAADALAKQATSAGSSLQYPAPRSLLKSIKKNSSLRRWQEEWDTDLTGRNIHRILPKVSLIPAPWKRQDIIFATGHGPFLSYFKRFHILKNLTAAAEVKWAIHSITPSAAHSQLLFASPNPPRIAKQSDGIEL
ncbi:hypothetical protein AVEN_135200-1 [Araneus ventricosus]|uniref:RNase H type-1 domain-containing protein n=1 Tax=Araneus ventricosus TaxID=182803 RepID=A0A4Y2PAA4_ARAVE|nr:hypothetical protein AVEN_135200-1 [Araneus ventricosus]